MRALRTSPWIVAVVIAACSSHDEPPYQPCTPGETSSCTCADGSHGAQICADTGDKYGACKCASPSTTGSGGSTSSSGGASASSSGGAATTTVSTGGASTSSATGGSSSVGSGGGGSTGVGAGGGVPLGAAWAFAYGDQASISSIAIDSTGNVLAAGIFQGMITLGASSATCGSGLQCLFAVKTTSSGQITWSKTFLGGGKAQPPRIAVGPSDEIMISSGFEVSMDFGAGPVVATASVFVVSYDATGTQRWFQHYDSDMQYLPLVSGIAVDAFGRTAISGHSVELYFGASSAGLGAFFAQLDSTGAIRWLHTLSNFTFFDPFNAGSAVTTTPAGDVVSVLSDRDEQSFSPCGAMSPGRTFVVGLDGETGACKFGRSLGGGGPASVAYDASDGTFVITGLLLGLFEGGSSTPLTPPSLSPSSFLVRLAQNGDPIHGVAFIATTTDVAINPITHEVAVTGANGSAVSVSVLTPAFDFVSNDLYAASSNSSGNAVRFSPDGLSLVIGGQFGGGLDFSPTLALSSTGQSAFLAGFVAPP